MANINERKIKRVKQDIKLIKGNTYKSCHELISQMNEREKR